MWANRVTWVAWLMMNIGRRVHYADQLAQSTESPYTTSRLTWLWILRTIIIQSSSMRASSRYVVLVAL